MSEVIRLIATVGLGVLLAMAILAWAWLGIWKNSYMLGLVWRLIYGPKHDFSEPLVMETAGHFWPINTCKECGLQYGLDQWQMNDLPASMAYGCKK